MSKMDKERMRLYQQERRKRLRGSEVSARIQLFVSPVKPKMDFDEIKRLRGKTVPIDDGYKIYFLFQGDEIVYIGQTRSLLNRISAHQNGTVDTAKKDFDSIAIVQSTKESVTNDERVYIGHYSPKHNVHNKQRQYITSADCQGCVSLRALVLKLETEVVLLRGREPILRTKDDAKKVVSMLPVREGRVAHHPACGCMMCRPPKVEKGS